MKLRKISEITATLPFTEFDFMQKYRESFKSSELGRIYRELPLKEMAEVFSQKMPARKPQGRKPMFSLEGEIALMFLKPYTGMSDDARRILGNLRATVMEGSSGIFNEMRINESIVLVVTLVYGITAIFLIVIIDNFRK